MEELSSDCLKLMMSFTHAVDDLPAVMATCKRFHVLASEDCHWEAFGRLEYNLTQLRAPVTAESSSLATPSSWIACIKSWIAIARRVDPEGRGFDASIYIRACTFWHCLEIYFEEHMPMILASLGPPAKYEQFFNLVKMAFGSSHGTPWMLLCNVVSLHDIEIGMYSSLSACTYI